MNRRNFIGGIAGILTAGAAPAFIPSGILMPLGKVWTPNPPVNATEVQQKWLEACRDLVWAEMQRRINPMMVLTPFGYVPMQLKGAPWFDLVVNAEKHGQPNDHKHSQLLTR